MWTSGSRVHGEWKTMSVCNDHALRIFPPLGLSHFRSPFFATMKVPSIKHSDKSICPACCRCCTSASSTCRMTPAFTQRLNRRKQVDPEGNRPNLHDEIYRCGLQLPACKERETALLPPRVCERKSSS
jgi:hypothetical protein